MQVTSHLMPYDKLVNSCQSYSSLITSYCYSQILLLLSRSIQHWVVYNIGIEGRNPTTLNITLVYNSDAEDINPVITTLGKGKQIRGCLTSIMSECEKR